MNFNYYSLEPGIKKLSGKGEEQDFNQVVEDYYKLHPEKFDDNSDTTSLKDIESIDPLLEKNPEDWYKAFGTAICTITGCVINNEDKKYIKKLYSELKKYSKNDSVLEELLHSRKFIFGCLPYIVVGFQVENKGWGKDGNNNIGNFLTMVKALSRGADVSSFLCAHREKKPSLVEVLDFESVMKASNLILGIRKNIHSATSSTEPQLTFFQPDASIEGVGAVFPEIFLTYLNSGKLGELIMGLYEHFNSLGMFLEHEYKGDVKVVSLKNHKEAIHEYATSHYGENWKSFQNLPRTGNDALDDMVESTAEKVQRFMPYYEQGINISNDLVRKNISEASKYTNEMSSMAELINGAVNDFSAINTAVSKAIYETVFYGEWGKRTKDRNGVIIGLERDHHLFQTMGIAFGYNDHKLQYNTNQLVPAMYARRNVVDNPANLNDLSFRQFWRISGQ